MIFGSVLLLFCAPIEFAQMRELLTDPYLEAARDRSVPFDHRHARGEIGLTGSIAVGFVVGVAVAFPVSQVLHQSRRGIAQMLGHVVRGGGFVAQKSKDAPAEVQAAEGALRKLGGTLERLIEVELPGVVDPRYLVIVRKTAATPRTYPRRPGLPAKQPIH